MELSHDLVKQCLAKFDLYFGSEIISQPGSEPVPNQQEIYLILMTDRRIRKPVLVASLEKNVNPDAKSMHSSGLLVSEAIDPLWGLRNYQVTNIASELNLPRDLWRRFEELVNQFYRLYVHFDCTYAEIELSIDNNTFTLTEGRMTVDSNSLFRHPQFVENADKFSNWVTISTKLSYLKLDGQIGCIVNGAGLAMAVMDMIHFYSNDRFHPANFIDICGVATIDTVAEALFFLAGDKNIRSILVNIFGGMTRCDEVAQGIVLACHSALLTTPLVVRFEGNNAMKAREIIEDARIASLALVDSLTEAVKKAVQVTEDTSWQS